MTAESAPAASFVLTADPVLHPAATADLICAPDVIVIDARTVQRLGDQGELLETHQDLEAFAAGHLPGARLADQPQRFVGPAGPFTAPALGDLERAIADLGISNSSRVLIYDGGELMWAARIWWLLQLAGHTPAWVLDGGIKAWIDDGGQVQVGVATATHRGAFTADPQPRWLAELDEVSTASAGTGSCLVSASLTQVFDRVAADGATPGRIAHSVNLPHDHLRGPDGRLRPIAVLREQLAVIDGDLDQRIITYCGGGIAATLDALVLHRLGATDVGVYAGSLREWNSVKR